MRRHAVLALLALGACGEAERQEPAAETARLSRILTDRGFGAPDQPVRVVFVVPTGDDARHPRLAGSGRIAPYETTWLFEDPEPVWTALATADGRFLPEHFPDPRDVWLTVALGRDAERDAPRIFFHGEKGQLSISCPDVPEGKRGGQWTVDAVAERSLVALLSRTPPVEIGAPWLWLEGARHKGISFEGVEIRVVRSEASLQRLLEELTPEPPGGTLRPPPTGLALGPQAYVAVWASQTQSERILRPARGRRCIRGKSFLWSLDLEDGVQSEAARGAPGLVGVFDLPEEVNRVEIAVGETQVSVAQLDDRGEYLPGRLMGRVESRIRERGESCLVSAVHLFDDGSFEWYCPSGGGNTRAGALPREMREKIAEAMVAAPASSVRDGMPTWVVTEGASAPAGFTALIDYLTPRPK